MHHSFLNANFPVEILANLKRDQSKKTTSNPTHWCMLDRPAKYGLDDIIFKIFMVPFKGNEMVFHEIHKVKCIFCLDVVEVEELNFSNARAHMNTYHKNAGAWNALVLDECEGNGTKVKNTILKVDDSSETESESETEAFLRCNNLHIKRKKLTN